MPRKEEIKRLKAKGPEYYWMRVLPVRAKERGLPCDVTLEYLKELSKPVIDPIGIVLDYHTQDRVNSTTATIDRIDNTRGYVQGNIRVVSHLFNTMKGASTPIDRLRMVLADKEVINILIRFLRINSSKYHSLTNSSITIDA